MSSNYVSTDDALVETAKTLLTERDKQRLRERAKKGNLTEAAFLRIAALKMLDLIEAKGYSALFMD